MVICVISLCLLLVLLAGSDGLALSAWPLLIQPNSAIAVLTDVMRTNILISATACLGQLKWGHFSSERPLNELQLFDDAGRGPWGSLVLLASMRVRAVIVWGLALITLVSLGIGPAAQQMLDFPMREVVMEEANARISTAYRYDLQDSRFPSELGDDPSALLRLRSDLIKGITGEVVTPYFNCPESAVRCTYPSFKSLGLCSSFRNMTDVATQDCAPISTSTTSSCNISWPRASDVVDLGFQPSTTLRMSFNYTKSGSGLYDDILNLGVGGVDAAGDIMISGVRMGGQTYDDGEIAQAEAFDSLLSWCVQVYDTAQGSSNGVPAKLIGTESLKITNPGEATPRYTSEATGEQYEISSAAFTFLADTLPQVLLAGLSRGTVNNQTVLSSYYDQFMDMLLYSSDLPDATANIAATMSNLMRSNAGGHNSAATLVPGEAFGTETYITVRWPWVVVPILETAVAVVLLAATIITAKRSKQPLLKSSSLGLLFHGIEGWTPARTADMVPRSETETEDDLGRIAKDVHVRFEESDEAGLRFVLK